MIATIWRLGVGDTIFVGDVMADYLEARNAGMRLVGHVASSWSTPPPSETAVITDITGLATYSDAN